VWLGVALGLESIPARLGVPRAVDLAKWLHAATVLVLATFPLAAIAADLWW